MFNKYLVLLLCILGLLGYFQSKLGELMVKKIKTHRPVKQRIIDSDDRRCYHDQIDAVNLFILSHFRANWRARLAKPAFDFSQ